MTDFAVPDYALVCLATAAGALILTPLAIRLARRLGVVDHPQPHKFHKTSTPYLGGIAVAAAVLTAALVPGSVQLKTIVVVGAAGLMATVGALDDWRILPAKPRLFAQAAAAAALWAVNIRVAATGVPAIDFVITVFVVLAIVNSVNLLDNMDGLASGTVAVAAGFFFIVAFAQGQELVALLAAALAGGCLGFLPFNFGAARVFLGDAGTMFIGYVLATLALAIDLPGHWVLDRVAIPWLILAVPLFDTTLVIWSRWRGHRPVFRGGTDHSSHRLVALGLSPRQAAVVTYATGAVGGGAALVILQAHSPAATLPIVATAGLLAVVLLALLERVGLGTTGEADEAGREPAAG